MKKCRIYLSTLFAAVISATSAQAIPFCPLIDPCPMSDFLDEATSVIQSFADTANNVQKTYKTTTDNLNNLKAAAMSLYNGELQTLVDVQGLNPGQKPMEQCVYLGKLYKNTSSDAVYDLTKILFLQYPSDDVEELEVYSNYRDKFYQDTIEEIYTAAQELQTAMDNEIGPSVDQTIACIKGESDCATQPNGNNDAVYVEGKALEAVSNLYTTLLKVTALRAQLAAVKVIHETEPMPYTAGVADQTADTADDEPDDAAAVETSAEEDEESAAAQPLQRVYATSTIRQSAALAFAQLGLVQNQRIPISALSAVENAAAGVDSAVDDALVFVVPPEAPSAHPYVYEADKMAELEKIAPADEAVRKAREVHNIIHGLSDYKSAAESMAEMQEQYANALESLRTVDKCAQAYLGRHFTNPQSVWGAKADVTNHDSRRGISGWAFQAYETAKAAQTTETSTADVVPLSIDSDTAAIGAPADTEANLTLLKNQGSVSPGKSKEEKAMAESRQSRMLSWQIGAEASKMLAAEPQKWGAPAQTPAFPVWQDVKSFYDQYLDSKYANVKKYLKSFSRNDILAVVAERLKGNNAEVGDTLRRQKAELIDSQLAAETQSANQDGQQAAKEYQVKYSGELGNLLAARAQVVKQLDSASAQLKTDSEQLANLRDKTQADAGDALRQEATELEDFPATLAAAPSGKNTIAPERDIDTLNDDFNKSVAKNKADSGIAALEQRVNSHKQKISGLEKDLAKIDNQIKLAKLMGQSGAATIVQEAAQNKANLATQAEKLADTVNAAYEKDVKTALMSVLRTKGVITKTTPMDTPEVVYSMLADSADSAMKGLYALVDKRVDQARKQMAALGDNLYNPEYAPQIEQIHQKMINDIKAMSVSVSALGVKTISGIQMYAKVLTADTSAETEDYFVGSTAKARDLKAPMAIFAQNLPPVREMFHFDETDFQNVKPYVSGNTATSAIIKSDFLNVGSEIPPVWQYMLRDHAFVEANIDLRQALSVGCPQEAFFRSGYMPCRVKGTALVIDVDANGDYFRSAANGSLPNCPYLTLESGKLYHTRRKVNVTLNIRDKTAAPDCKYSELGTLFEADQSGTMRFRQPTYDAYYAIIKDQSSNGKEPSAKEKRYLIVAERAPLAFNQIGEFLVYAENERTQREQLEELQSQYDKMMNQLFDLLKSYGYEPSASLNLAKEQDYNLVRGKLDNIKNQSVAEALLQIAEIDTADNQVVAERVDGLKSIINALQKDKDELTIIGDSVADQNNLDEEIKTSKVNNDVAGKFLDSLNKASEAIKLPEAPYCAAY